MNNVKNNVLHRLLAIALSIIMTISIIPFSTVVYAATTAHPDAVTVTVVDDVTGEPIEGAKVTYVIYDNDRGEDVTGADENPTDANGEIVVFEGSDPGNIKISSITVTHDDYATFTNDAYDQAITSLQDNFTIKMTCTKIKDVDIVGKTLTYKGEAQKLVSVTEVEGDTVEYYLEGATGPVSEVPTATDAGTYSVRVVVTRTGKTPLEETVQTVIKPAKIEGISIAGKNIAYNETAQELVTLTGSFEENDVVTWTVNTDDTVTKDIPTATAVGPYTIILTVDRGSNYEKLVTEAVTTNLIEGELDLEDLIVTGLEGIYTVEDGTPKAQAAVAVENKGDYDLKYQLDDGDLTVDDSAWVDDIPTVTDAGSYIVWVKAVKDSYNNADVTVTPAASAVAPYNVYIAKAPQSLGFADNAPSEVTLGSNNEYDFTASGENLSGKDIEYSLVDATAEDVATVTADGKLTVANAGIVTVKAFRAGNENYLDAVVYKTVVVKNASTELVTFDSDSENYVLDEGGNVSEKAATPSNTNDNGTLTYSIDNAQIGLAINHANGKVTVTDEWKLMRAMWNNNGSVTVTVTVNKAEGSLEGKKWVFADGAWNSQTTNEKVYAADTDNYKILITFAEAPSFGDVCNIANPDPVSGWYNAEYPATITPIDATKYTIALDDAHWTNFGGSVTIEDQGSETHYVFLKDINTKQVSAPIAVDIDVDTVKPAANQIKVEYSKSPMDKFLEVITLGFYKPSVTVRFTACDVTSGVDYFTWGYTKEIGASTINHPDSVSNQKVDAVQDNVDSTKYTGEFTITADEYNQYRGYLSVTATDNANNTSDVKKDSGNVFVIDTVNPQMSIKYEGADPYTSEIDAIGSVHYFNGDVEVELTITEANFYSEDVTVVVTKDGQTYDYGTVNWGNRNAEDKTVGTFALAGDGDYVVTVTATDKSGNEMVPYTSETITVDKTKPVIDSAYNKDAQNITITIDEHNFRASDITVAVEALDISGKTVSVKDIQAYVQNEANWTSNGDIRTLVLESTGANKMLVDAIYKLTINYMDISDNPAVTEVTESSLIDHTGPSGVSIEIVTDPIETFFEIITFGFYNPSVTIKFTAYDEEAGVESFTWNYTKENGASDINRATDVEATTVAAIQDTLEPNKFTATITLPDTDATQLRGYLAAFATDTYGNASDKVTDDKNIIVVDTVAPEVSVEYSKSSRDIDGKAYYNGDVEATITVKEANFYATDVVVKVSKNGAAATAVTPAWTTDESDGDIHYGKFTMTGDGHYIVTVEYTDKSDNFDEKKSTYTSHEITIDTIKPVINVEYQNKTVANKLTDRDGNEREYFADTQTAVITINEHNFISDEVDFTIIAKDVTGAELDVDVLNSKTDWTVDTTGDIHTITITYPGDANYTFDVAYTDKATNAADDYATDYFTVDKTNPKIADIKYSTSIIETILKTISFGFYDAKAEVEITAQDSISGVHSFDYSYVLAKKVSSVNKGSTNNKISAKNIEYSTDGLGATATFEIPKKALNNKNQFNGTVEVTATDRSGNVTTKKDDKRIVVDNISPKRKITFNEPINKVNNVSYYNGNIDVEIEITEANFYKNDIKVEVSKDGSAYKVSPKWNPSSYDVHYGKFKLTEDGHYIVTVTGKDKSGNELPIYKSNQLTIDTDIQAPTYSINGVSKNEVGGSYKEDVKVSFNYQDENFDTKNIKLVRKRFDKEETVTQEFIKANDDAKGGSGSFTIPSEVENDGIYLLTIEMTDKANHSTQSQLKFTVNRFGSVYEYNDDLVNLIRDEYTDAVKKDLVITEYNASLIDKGSLDVLITRDGEKIDVEYTTDSKTTDSGVSYWNQYVYKIKASNFEKDGVYKISLSSKYSVDDSKNNDSTSVPENSTDSKGKQIEDTMSFVVDSSAPEIRNVINLEKAIVNAQSLDVEYNIIDVGGLKSIEIILNGKTHEKITEFDGNPFNYSGKFTITEQSEAQTVQFRITDLANNVTDTSAKSFTTGDLYIFNDTITVSTNFFVRWYADKLAFWGSIAGVVVLAGAIWFFIAAKKKKKEAK